MVTAVVGFRQPILQTFSWIAESFLRHPLAMVEASLVPLALHLLDVCHTGLNQRGTRKIWTWG